VLPPPRPTPDQQLVLDAMPAARRRARKLARCLHVSSASGTIEDCEQVAYLALLESRPRHDKDRAPFDVYAFKRVAGAVRRFVRRERRDDQTGFDDALDAAGELVDTSDPFADDDDALGDLKGQCRWISFRRFMGRTRAALREQPDSVLLRARIREALERALGTLSEQEMQFLTLRYWEERTWEAVGEALGVDERQARRIDERLRARLKRDLRAHGVEEPPPSEEP